jgi:putative GTP pyrophosphokinase
VLRLSKTQIDRLGDRLRKGDITEADLRLLDDYRRSFGEAYELVVGAIRSELGLEPTGRPAKSTTSISEKLNRESIRLSQIQDIAGCRLVVPDILEQSRVIGLLAGLFTNTATVDRREKPSHGYRAVHVIVRIEEKLVEVQVRSSLQHVWAELSEKLSDLVDPRIKYGGGDEWFVRFLQNTSNMILGLESGELQWIDRKKRVSLLLAKHGSDPERREKLLALQRRVQDIEKEETELRNELFQMLRHSLDTLPREEGGSDAISD